MRRLVPPSGSGRFHVVMLRLLGVGSTSLRRTKRQHCNGAVPSQASGMAGSAFAVAAIALLDG
jgi:hypothetical protein